MQRIDGTVGTNDICTVRSNCCFCLEQNTLASAHDDQSISLIVQTGQRAPSIAGERGAVPASNFAMMGVVINASIPVHVTNTIQEPKQITQTVKDPTTGKVSSISGIFAYIIDRSDAGRFAGGPGISCCNAASTSDFNVHGLQANPP